MNIRRFSAIKAALLLVCGAQSAVFMSCKKKSAGKEPEPEISVEASTHAWFYFAADGFQRTDKPRNAPYIPPQPWTEAVRIAEFSCADPADGSEPKAYALVNRRGILAAQGQDAVLYADPELFGLRTASNLVFLEDTPVFSLYTSTFFNSRRQNPHSPAHPFLVQFEPASRLCIPLVNTEDLGVPEDSEITDLIWDGQFWTCCVKTAGAERTEFSYLTFQTKIPLLSVPPSQAAGSLILSAATVQDFRRQKEPRPFGQAPERLKSLLATLPPTSEYMVSCRTAGGHSPRSYIRQESGGESGALTAAAILADTWSGALFQDGTLFLNGALYGKSILNGGRTIALRLPKLPAGFRYGEFAISGTTLYAAWEEHSFFNTGRSGFLSADLDEILYQS